MKYYYYISYIFDGGYGNTFAETENKIRTYEDSKPIIEEIEKSVNKKVCILNYNLLDSE